LFRAVRRAVRRKSFSDDRIIGIFQLLSFPHARDRALHV
jgi:hypothetical protein